MTTEEAYWRGYYTAARDLSTSPRMTKAQKPAIERAAALAREKLETFGVEFTGPAAFDDAGHPSPAPLSKNQRKAQR